MSKTNKRQTTSDKFAAARKSVPTLAERISGKVNPAAKTEAAIRAETRDMKQDNRAAVIARAAKAAQANAAQMALPIAGNEQAEAERIAKRFAKERPQYGGCRVFVNGNPYSFGFVTDAEGESMPVARPVFDRVQE